MDWAGVREPYVVGPVQSCTYNTEVGWDDVTQLCAYNLSGVVGPEMDSAGVRESYVVGPVQSCTYNTEVGWDDLTQPCAYTLSGVVGQVIGWARLRQSYIYNLSGVMDLLGGCASVR